MIVLLQTKNGDKRSVPLIGLARELMVAHGKVRRLDTDLVFPGLNPQKPIDITKPWETALRKAGLTDFRFHDLRHTSASYLAMSGASLIEIANVLGHRTLAMVRRYSHLSAPHTASIVERMNSQFLPG